MHDTLSSLIERAITGNQRPLEFYLREHSRLPGSRANLELANDVSYLLAASCSRRPDDVRSLLDYLICSDNKHVTGNTPAEFVMLCGLIAFGACAAVQVDWREETFDALNQYACSPYWRIREGVAIAYQHLLNADPKAAIARLKDLASSGNYLQQRAAVAAIAEPPLLYNPDLLTAALELQRIVLERMRNAPLTVRKNEDFRVLRRALGYTLSVITAAGPEQGFALMRECASWGDPDITWILRENLRKKRLAKFSQDTAVVSRLLP